MEPAYPKMKGLRVAKMSLSRKEKFYAAHRNTAIEDQCACLHGHTYWVTFHVAMPRVHEQSGVTLLFSEFEKAVRPIIEALDHSTLVGEDDGELVEWLQKMPGPRPQKIYRIPYGQTSAENLALHLAERAKEAGLNCYQVDLQETEKTTVTYRTAGAPW